MRQRAMEAKVQLQPDHNVHLGESGALMGSGDPTEEGRKGGAMSSCMEGGSANRRRLSAATSRRNEEFVACPSMPCS
jgi:hypothetical protein